MQKVRKLFSKLRIGEKIGLSFGLVGLLFLGVIWHYHKSLDQVLSGYERLHQIYEVRKSHALEIEVALAEIRQAESDFLIRRDERFAAEVDSNVATLLQSTDALAAVEQGSRQTAQRIRELTERYLDRFHDIVDAWRVKGLDHNSGLQGAFRNTVHELEDRAGNFKAGRIHLQLLQIRRGEKDLGLRREALYRDRVRGLIEGFRSLVTNAELYPEVQEALLAELAIYENAFESYAQIVLSGGELNGGKGPFRDSAHRLEKILKSHYVPDLETDILQLRRREKDYLLRNDQAYVRMVAEIAGRLRDQIGGSPIAQSDKVMLTRLLSDYERDFNALVAQNDRIGEMGKVMRKAAQDITPLVKQNALDADRLAAEKRSDIATSSRERAQLNLIIVACAVVLGVFFSFIITLRIVRPVREMAGLLDRLTDESPSERIATVPDARDEINAMAESVNTLADNRATFVKWWQSSMDEAIALRDLHAAPSKDAQQEAAEELRLASLSKVQQINSIRGQVDYHAAQIIEIAARQHQAGDIMTTERDSSALKHSAQRIQTLLKVIEK